MSDNDYYLRCLECGWRSEINVIMKPFCPKCDEVGVKERLVVTPLMDGFRGYTFSRKLQRAMGVRDDVETTRNTS